MCPGRVRFLCILQYIGSSEKNNGLSSFSQVTWPFGNSYTSCSDTPTKPCLCTSCPLCFFVYMVLQFWRIRECSKSPFPHETLLLCIPLARQAIDSSSGKTRTMTKEVLESDVGGSCQENLLSVLFMLMVMMEKSPIKI